MAWDNPSGILSPNERDRLKREAEIFAEAQRKMLREEEQRASKQREAEERRRAAERDIEERTRRAEERRARYSQPSVQNRGIAILEERLKAIEEKIRASERTPEGIVHRAEKVRSSYVGSRDYLEARYGIDAYKHNQYRLTRGGGYNIHKIEELIAEDYSPDDPNWKRYECAEVETLLSLEEKQRAEYEPKCRTLIDFISKIKAEQKSVKDADRELMDRAEKVRSSEIGSAEYLIARYGEHAYQTMLDMVIKQLGITKDNANAYLSGSYSEDIWRSWEDKELEQLLGNR